MLLRTRLMIQLGKIDTAMETVIQATEADHKNANVWALKVVFPLFLLFIYFFQF